MGKIMAEIPAPNGFATIMCYPESEYEVLEAENQSLRKYEQLCEDLYGIGKMALFLSGKLELDKDKWLDELKVIVAKAAKVDVLEQRNSALMEALKYHQEQTRPIERTVQMLPNCPKEA